MKKVLLTITIVLTICLILIPTLDARGGRGGGRGGGSRGGGRSMNRSPSMSRVSHSRPTSRPTTRPATRPSKPTTRPSKPSTRPVKRPAARPDRPGRPERPATRPERPSLPERPATRPERPSRPERPAARPERPSLPERPAARPERPSLPERPATRPERPGRPERPTARPERPGNQHDLGNRAREDIGKNRPNRGDWFDDDFWNRQGYYPPYHRRVGNGWRWASAAGIANWLRWQRAPLYYGYYYDDDYGDYYWGTEEGAIPSTDYGQGVEDIETATQVQTSDDWMPLGVFALTKNEESDATPNVYMQLAVNKDGLISGTIYSALSDQAYELEGLVDQDSQLASWKMADSENSPIVETGLYNLTKDETPIRILFADENTQEMLLVRLEEPKE